MPFKHGSVYDSVNGQRRRVALPFSQAEREFNRAMRRWRSRVEHYIGYMSRFRILGGKFRGRDPLHNPMFLAAIKIITHLDAGWLRRNPLKPLPLVSWFPRMD